MRRYLIAGLLVWVPLGITLWVLNALVSALDQTLLLVPERLRPDNLLGFHIPGFGVLLSFLILLGTGALAANFFGARLSGIGSRCRRHPVRQVDYSPGEQVSDTRLRIRAPPFARHCWSSSAPRVLDDRVPDRAPAAAVASHLSGEYVSV